MRINPNIDRAAMFAYAAHTACGQVRKYTGEPYFNHCNEVATLVAEHGGTDEMIQAAYLHDTVEDTAITIGDITRNFGHDVSAMVWYLTDQSTPDMGNRAIRKAYDRHHITTWGTRDAKIIKFADLISNTKSIVEHDIAFAHIYIPEKILLLNAIADSDPTLTDHPLYIKAYELAANARDTLMARPVTPCKP